MTSSAPNFRRPSSVFLTSDATTMGWGGGACAKATMQTEGNWKAQEKDRYINALELLAALVALKSICKTDCNEHIIIEMDNTTAVTYINHKCGRK